MGADRNLTRADDADSQAPRSIRELAEMAKVDFDPSLSVKSYVRSATKLHQQFSHAPLSFTPSKVSYPAPLCPFLFWFLFRAQLYESQHQLELAFVYLVRAAKLVSHYSGRIRSLR